MREGSANLEVSQLLDPSMGPSRLPAIGDLKKTISVNTKKKLMRKVIYKHLCDKIEKVGFSYELSLEEQSLTQLHELAVTRSSTITTVVRSVSKGIEYLVWYSIERGWDSAGQEVIGSGTYLPHGLDKDVEIKQLKNSENIVTKLQLGTKYTDIFTEEFTSEKLESLLNNSDLSEKIQYSFTDNLGKSYGAFTAQEMIHCSAKELY